MPKKTKNQRKAKGKYIMFNKICLFTVEEHLTKAKDAGLTEDPIHFQIINQINAYKQFGKFSLNEAKAVIKMGLEDDVQRITSGNYDWIIFALELLKLWVDHIPKDQRPHLNMNDARLKIGRSQYAVQMMKLKQTNPEQYSKEHEIIRDSGINAKKFFMLSHEKLVGGFLQM